MSTDGRHINGSTFRSLPGCDSNLCRPATGDVTTAVSCLHRYARCRQGIAEALALSDEERAAVAEELLASLDPTRSDDSPEAVAAFKAALDRRWAAYQSGEEPGIPWPEVRAWLRARLNRG